MKLVEIKNLSKIYRLKNKKLTALNHISLALSQGEVFGLVGESGSGKSTLGKCLLGLEKATDGEIFFEGKSVACFSQKEKLLFKKKVQIIFQDPYASLDPRMTTFDLIAEPLYIHKECNIEKRVHELLGKVGLSISMQDRFAHEFSGGQRQRIGIARALALNPTFIVCDESISALDVSIQAQIINLLKELQENLKITLLFIAHDLAMVRYFSDQVGVMYLGNLVELGPTESLYSNPLHPYTQALLAANPSLSKKKKPLLLLPPDTPFPPSQGCPFAHRCPHVMPICKAQNPLLEEKELGHTVACHLY